VKAVGGGKTAPAKDYKDRKDIGTQRKRSEREQQPTQKRGSASLSPREQQKKARAERLAAKSSGKSKKELTKAADKLLTKKTAKKVDPNYKAQKASGYTRIERQKIRRAGQRLVKDIQQGKEKHISHYNFKL
jgi:ribosomal protein L17